MSRARIAAILTLSLVALRALPAQDRRSPVTPTAELARALVRAPNERAAARWSSRGRALYDSSRYRESIASFELALTLGADRPGEEAWNIARGYARLGNRKQALRWLSHALEMGFSCRGAIRDEPAFAPYREESSYRDIVELGWKLRARQPTQLTL
jgi:tetratricopeptide (TPR) repeat protein